MSVIRTLLSPRGAVFLLLALLVIAITILDPSFMEPGRLMRFIQRVAPIALVAIGQYFVIIAGEFDLSQGAVITAQVIMAGALVGDDPSRTVPVLLIMTVAGLAIGAVNGVLTTQLKIPSFIVTLGMMLALLGAVKWWTGGSASGNPADNFREIGRGGLRDVPVLDFLPWAALVLAVWIAIAVWLTKRPLGKLLMATGDNARAVDYVGGRRPLVTTAAFMISSLSATVAGVLLVGYAGVHPKVGEGYEFDAITAVVLGGVVLGGGRGWLAAAVAGAFTLEALFVLLNFAGINSDFRDAVQGAIIIAAVAVAAPWVRRPRRRASPSNTDKGPGPDHPSPAPAHPSAGTT